jgi:hypothetical protein
VCVCVWSFLHVTYSSYLQSFVAADVTGRRIDTVAEQLTVRGPDRGNEELKLLPAHDYL